MAYRPSPNCGATCGVVYNMLCLRVGLEYPAFSCGVVSTFLIAFCSIVSQTSSSVTLAFFARENKSRVARRQKWHRLILWWCAVKLVVCVQKCGEYSVVKTDCRL